MTRALLFSTISIAALALAACGKSAPADNNTNNTRPDVVLFDEDMTTVDMSVGGMDQGATTPEEDMGQTTPPADMSSNPSGLTYYEHVRPILRDNCVECHATGGIGAFALETYEQVKPLAMVLVSAVERGAMPPWMPQDGCGDTCV